VPELLSICAALSWGLGDFFGGRSAVRMPALTSAFWVQLTGFALLSLWVPWNAEWPTPNALAWSALAGVCGGLSALTLYPALSLGDSCEVAPLSALIGTALPVCAGVLGGERPSTSAWVGIALAALTIGLVTSAPRASERAPSQRRRALLLAATSGLFIGAFLIAFERAGSGQGLLPLFVARCSGVPLFLLALVVRREPLVPRGGLAPSALAAGALDMTANACYLEALSKAPLAIVATLSNLYPAFTVLCGVLLLRERPRPLQQLGFVLALAAIAMITR
jgi:drug/metabolite transporter (DMT)-like permease